MAPEPKRMMTNSGAVTGNARWLREGLIEYLNHPRLGGAAVAAEIWLGSIRMNGVQTIHRE